MSLYHKYRPETLEEIKGNSEVILALSKMLSNPKSMPHTYLFHGGTGCGKTTLSRIIKTVLEISKGDYSEIDSAQFNGVEMVRELRRNCQYVPIKSKYRLYVIDECHMLSKAAMEAFLKIMEDTPRHVIFIFCTTEPDKLKSTFKGRCQQFELKPLDEDDMKRLLKSVVKKEGDILETNIYKEIIKTSEGYPRNALQTLEKVLNTEPEKRIEAAKESAMLESQSIELCRALLDNSPWKKVSNILSGLKGQEPEGIRRHVMGYCVSVVLKGKNVQAASIMEQFREPFYSTGFSELVLACYIIINVE